MNAADIRENLKSRFWGLPEKIAIWLEQVEVPNPAITISTRREYKQACRLYGCLERSIDKTDWRSPEALRLLAQGSEIIRFEMEYEEEFGNISDIGSEDGASRRLQKRSAHQIAIGRAISYLFAIGSIEDSGERRITRRGRRGIVYVWRRRNS
jgi:hypothetical protein